VNLSFAKGVSVDTPYVREVPPGQMISASFMTLKNDSDKEIALIKASSDVAKTVELHEHVHEDGMMKMRQVPKIVIPANGTTELKPGGYHIMLIGLQRKIKAGDKIELNLEFDNGDKETITATVKKVMMGMMKGNKMGGMKAMQHGAMKMDTTHLNPMPNLMKVFKKSPEKLNLSPEQAKKLKAGIAERSPKIKDLFKAVTKYEKEILQAALADKPLSEIDQLANNIVQERLNIINSKAGCAESVKAILDEKQFANLQATYKESYAKKLEYADDMQGKMAMLKHVNPMPNLMIVVKKMSDKLNLTEKQAGKLKQWHDERGPVMNKQYKTIVKLENDLQEAALNNAAPEKLAELADGIMQNRMKVMRGKAFCRDKIKEILKPEQYKKILELYKTNFITM
jgi:copper(I)-binding protein